MRTIILIITMALMLSVGYGDEASLEKLLGRVKKGQPQTATFAITAAWSEQELESGYKGWHFEGSRLGVRLYPEPYKLESLDQKKKYRVDGVLLQQDYGVFSVWVYELSELTNDH